MRSAGKAVCASQSFEVAPFWIGNAMQAWVLVACDSTGFSLPEVASKQAPEADPHEETCHKLECKDDRVGCLKLLSRLSEMLMTWQVSLCSITSFKRLPTGPAAKLTNAHATNAATLASRLARSHKDESPRTRLQSRLGETCQADRAPRCQHVRTY